MNKNEFIDQLSSETTYDEETCNQINAVVERHLIIGKNNKRKIKRELVEQLEIDDSEADDIYNKIMDILTREFKNKIKHPLN